MNNESIMVDLHTHTLCSDGRLSPTELVRLMVWRGITVASITDHDSTEGLAEALEEASHHPGLTLVPGIEISAEHPHGGGDLHILGYFIDHLDAGFQKRLRSFREDREGRARRMVQRLADLGLPLDWKRVEIIAAGASIGRPHIAQAMVERGYIKHTREAFQGYLDDDGQAYVDRPRISTQEAVDMIRGVGGVAVLAHPIYCKNYRELVSQAAGIGMVGLEVH